MKVSRRNFIKASTVGAATLTLAGGLFSADKWLRPVDAASDSQEKTAFTFHPPDCGGRCSHKCTVREGRMVKIEPNDWTDNRYSLICLKGLSEVEHVYSTERLQTPLKRVGKRGENKFVPISWDEALTTIADKLKKLQSQYGGKSILFGSSWGVDYSMPFIPSLLGAQVDGGNGIDIGIANGLEDTTGDFFYGAMYNDIKDWVNAKTIVLLGINILETTLTDSQFFFDAKDAGAQIICVDPSYTTTVAKSDQWMRIKPGTDGALLLAMINLVLENKWYKEDYLQKNTAAPFLIRLDNQKLLRQNNSEDKADKNPYMVWDEISNSLKPYNTPGIRPKCEGEFEVNGVRVKTVLTKLKEHQKQFTAQWAAQITDIPEQNIIDLTRRYALNGPAVLGWGWGGPDKWTNSDVTGHAGGILAVLTGNIGVKGGGVGCPIGHYITWGWDAALGSWTLPTEFKATPLEMPVADMRYKSNSVKALINHGNYLQQHFANLNKTVEWLDTLELVVTIAPYHNTSVDLADIVLPACTSYETEYAYNNLTIQREHVLLQQKVIDPLHESKSDFQIEKELAAKLGFGQYLPKTKEDYLRAVLDTKDPRLSGITLETLTANNCVMRMKVPTEPYVGHLDQVYDTPSGKLELYHENMIEFDQALPKFEVPTEAGNNKYPLQMSQAHTKYRVHSQFVEARWINQLDPEPRVEMNPSDAQSRGLSNGDMVEVLNDRGSFKARCKFTEALRPGVIRQYEGWWTKHMAAGNLQNVTNDSHNPRGYKRRYGPVIPYNDTYVEVKKA